MAATEDDWGGWKFAIVATGGGFKVAFSAGVLFALHATNVLRKIVLLILISGAAIFFSSYYASNRRWAGIALKFKELERVGSKRLFNTPHYGRDLVLDWLAKRYPIWEKIVATAWNFAEAVFGGILRKGPPPNAEGVRSLVEEIDAAKLIAEPTEIQVVVHRRATKEDPVNRQMFVSNHDARFDPARGGNPKDYLEEIIGSASFPPFIRDLRNRSRFDGFYIGKGLREAAKRANIVIVLVNDQPGGDLRDGAIPELMKAYNTLYNPLFVCIVKEALRENPEYTVWTGDSEVPYLAEIAAFARSIGRYGMSDHCLMFPAPEHLIGELCTAEFESGDLVAGMTHGMEVGKKVIAELRATYKRYHPTNDAPAV